MGSRRGECERFRNSGQGGTLELLSRGECDSAARRFDSKGGKQCVLDPLQQRWGLEFACRAIPCATMCARRCARNEARRSRAPRMHTIRPRPPRLRLRARRVRPPRPNRPKTSFRASLRKQGARRREGACDMRKDRFPQCPHDARGGVELLKRGERRGKWQNRPRSSVR